MSVAFRSLDVSASPARNQGDAIVSTDGELLMRFVRHRDHVAFAQIVERHGRLVWMICRQVLRHHQDVEDAFQATFLILADRAQSIRASDSAAAWLFGVAQRTALSARRKRMRRREESLIDELPATEESVRAIDNREMLYVLMQEIQSLPDRYQAPLVMRYLEGQSRRAIAEQTDSTVGQIQGRLVRGRRMLRSRFLRRGASLSLAAGAAASDAVTAEAAITRLLVDSTAEACLNIKNPGTASGLSPAVLALVREGVRAMWVTFATKCAAVVSAVTLTAGIVWAAQQGGGQGDVGAEATAKKAALQVVAGKAGEGHPAPAADAKAPALKPAERLQNRSADTRNLLSRQTDEKAELTARLELNQLEKAALQRKIEHLEAWLNERDTPALNLPVPKEDPAASESLADNVRARLAKCKDELAKQIRATADASRQVDRVQFEIAQRQRELDELARLRLQIELADEMAASQQKTVSKPFAPGGKLAPGDAIYIQVANALTSQPIGDVYHVESMGTVALGPSYGRVKVAGLTILEAEEAVKKHLAAIIENPELQISEAPAPSANLVRTEGRLQVAGSYVPPTPYADFNANQTAHEIRHVPTDAENQQVRIIKTLQQEQETLRKQNAELKKQLEQRTQLPATSRDPKKSEPILRSGDVVGIRVVTARGLGAREEATYVANVDADGNLVFQSDSTRPKIHVAGFDEPEAKKAIGIVLGLSSGQELHLEYVHSGQDPNQSKK